MILTLAELKAELGIADSQEDALLAARAAELQGRFEDHCGRLFDRATVSAEEHNGGARAIYLRRFPVESVALVESREGETFTLDEDFFLYHDRGVLVVYSGLWPDGFRNLRASYTGGYVAAGTTPSAGQSAMPEGLRRAFRMQFAYEWRNRVNLGRAQVNAQGGSIQLSPAGLLPDVEKGLAPYRRI